MAESDLYILASSGDFGTNYFKGLFGVWLQAMVLTAIGVFAGTFLSWPVALLTTIAFFVAARSPSRSSCNSRRQSLLGGGPFVSLIRLLTHDNQMTDLAPTFAVVAAKTLDSLVMPVMSRLVYIVPNFSALDVSNTVADGFAVSWGQILANILLALALRPAVLARRIFHPEESGGRRMRTAPNQNRKIIYGLVIVALFGAMLPYSQWLNREKSEKDLGEAAIGQVDTGSFMLKLVLLGGARGIAANVLWTRAEELQARPGLGPPEGDRRPDHQAPAPLPLGLDLPGLEPRLQRLGRVGRPRGQVRVDQAGDQVPPGGGRPTTAGRPT